MSTELQIRLATLADSRAVFEHYMRHFAESGTEGDIVFHPLQEFWQKRDLKYYVDRWDVAWDKPTSEAGWERAWILFADGDRAVGHVTLRSLGLQSNLHRCLVGLGLERHARGGGWGRRLMEAALAWAREQSILEYVDLDVFSHNTKARALYASLGFIETGHRIDQFRVGSQSIDDIRMELKLR